MDAIDSHPQIVTAIIAGVVAIIGWIVTHVFSKKIEEVKLQNSTQLEGVKLVNAGELARLQSAIELLNSHQMKRREVLVGLLKETENVQSAVWDLVSSVGNLRAENLLARTADALSRIASFYSAKSTPEALALVTEDEQKHIDGLDRKVTTLFLKLDLDEGRKPGYEADLVMQARQIEASAKTFRQYVRSQLNDIERSPIKASEESAA